MIVLQIRQIIITRYVNKILKPMILILNKINYNRYIREFKTKSKSLKIKMFQKFRNQKFMIFNLIIIIRVTCKHLIQAQVYFL